MERCKGCGNNELVKKWKTRPANKDTNAKIAAVIIAKVMLD